MYFFLSILSIFTLLIQCQSTDSKENKGYFVEFTDSYQRTIRLETEPQRIISLSPAITEMIFLLKNEQKLVGISDYCNYPPATDSIAKVGGLIQLNIETIVALRPDIVLIGSIVGKEEIAAIEKIGIPVVAIREEKEIEGIYQSLQTLGEILNCPAFAEEKINELKDKLNQVSVSIKATKNQKSVFYVVGFGVAGDFTAPKESHIHEIITRAGGRNIGETLTGWRISRELIFEQDPDYIFIRKEDSAFFVNAFPYEQLRSVKEGNTYAIESGWIDIVSPRNIDAIVFIHQCLNEK